MVIVEEKTHCTFIMKPMDRLATLLQTHNFRYSLCLWASALPKWVRSTFWKLYHTSDEILQFSQHESTFQSVTDFNDQKLKPLKQITAANSVSNK